MSHTSSPHDQPSGAEPRPHPPSFTLERDNWGRLVVILEDGTRYSPVSAVRMFPISSPDGPLSLCDSRGREIAWVEQLDDTNPTTRRLLEDELGQRDFIPIIERIYSVSSLTEPCEWDVATDRGRATLVLKAEEDFHRIGPHRALIVDARGLRFLLPDSRQLDAASRRYAEWWGM